MFFMGDIMASDNKANDTAKLERKEDAGKELDNIEMALSRPNVVGIKIYAGYYPYYVIVQL